LFLSCYYVLSLTNYWNCYYKENDAQFKPELAESYTNAPKIQYLLNIWQEIMFQAQVIGLNSISYRFQMWYYLQENNSLLSDSCSFPQNWNWIKFLMQIQSAREFVTLPCLW